MAIDSAAANGHLHVVQWLTSNLPALTPTTTAMDGAASAGHLSVVKFLHEATKEGCTTDAMDSAARRGHTEVREWIVPNNAWGNYNTAARAFSLPVCCSIAKQSPHIMHRVRRRRRVLTCGQVVMPHNLHSAASENRKAFFAIALSFTFLY